MDTLISEIIVEKAESFIGKEEKPGNMGFKDSKFDRLMRWVGFRDTHAWCVYFCELVWTLAYKECDERKLPDLKRLFTGGAVRTFRRFKADPNFETGDVPRKGAIAFYQQYRNNKPTTMGHAAICTRSGLTYNVHTIDGNTNDNGSREGVKVAEKARRYNIDQTSGLVLLGFVYAPGIEGQ